MCCVVAAAPCQQGPVNRKPGRVGICWSPGRSWKGLTGLLLIDYYKVSSRKLQTRDPLFIIHYDYHPSWVIESWTAISTLWPLSVGVSLRYPGKEELSAWYCPSRKGLANTVNVASLPLSPNGPRVSYGKSARVITIKKYTETKLKSWVSEGSPRKVWRTWTHLACCNFDIIGCSPGSYTLATHLFIIIVNLLLLSLTLGGTMDDSISYGLACRYLNIQIMKKKSGYLVPLMGARLYR